MSLTIIEESAIKRPWGTTRRIITACLTLIIGLGLFTLAYIGMQFHTGLGSFDQSVLDWFVHHRDPYVTSVMQLLTTLASPVTFAAVVTIGAVIWTISKRQVWRPFLLVGAMGAAAIISMLLKNVFAHARPPHHLMISPLELDYSFPSGHTIVITVAILVLGYLICSRRTSAGHIVSWVFLSIIGIGLIAASRLYLGYHWLTDVSASIGLGFIILATIIFIDVALSARFKKLQ